MNIYDRLVAKLTQGRKAKDKRQVVFYSTVIGELGRMSDGKAYTLKDTKVIQVIKRMRKDIVETKGENWEWEEAQLTEYIPTALKQEEIMAIVDKRIIDIGATTPKDIGPVMGSLREFEVVMDMKFASFYVKKQLLK